MIKNIKTQRDPISLTTHVSMDVNLETILCHSAPEMVERLIASVSKTLAEIFLKEKGQEILARLDPQAIANLCIAQSAGKVLESFKGNVKS